MKHFRDLVLSTKEPAVKNVLWIKPVEPHKYKVLMYEDNWFPLFGGDGSGDSAISYITLNGTYPDGFKVQLQDLINLPDEKPNLYPVTKANVVYMNNGDTVENVINNIKRSIENAFKPQLKAIPVLRDAIDSFTYKTNRTFILPVDSEQWGGFCDDTYARFEADWELRTYIDETNYKKTRLTQGDIVVLIDTDLPMSPPNKRIVYVNSINTDTETVGMLTVPSESLINQKISNLLQSIVMGVDLDGESTLDTNNVAQLRNTVHKAYMLQISQLEDYYPGDTKIGKTFFFNYGENDGALLRKYTSSSEYIEIPLLVGDLIYNLHEQLNINDIYSYKTIYLYSGGAGGSHSNTVHALAFEEGFEYLYSIVSSLDTTYAEVNYASDNVHIYKALKQGQEQMLVLKSMGSVFDEMTLYDYNDDGKIDSKDVEILWGLIQHNSITQDGVTYTFSGTTLYIDGHSSDKIIDINNDALLNGADVTSLYNIILNRASAVSPEEFSGMFAIFDPTDNKIKIGYNYGHYINPDYQFEFLLELTPSPNVIYCNSNTNILYRWNTKLGKMVEVNPVKRTFYGGFAQAHDTNTNSDYMDVVLSSGDPADSIENIDQIILICNDTISLEDTPGFNCPWKIRYGDLEHGGIDYGLFTLNGFIASENVVVVNEYATLAFKPLSRGKAKLILLNNPSTI